MERMTIRGDHGVYMAPGWDFGKQGGPKEISYYDAAVLLAETADKLYQQESSGKGNADG